MGKNLLLPIAITLFGFSISIIGQTVSVSGLSGSQYKADRIIDDSLFYRSADLSGSQIQNFLNSKVPVCDTNGEKMYTSTMTRKEYAASKGVSTPFICLKGYKQDTPAKTDDLGLCGNLSARSDRSAAAIIYDVSRVCGISTKVLLVLLQKEQSLVTDDWPWPIQYQKATGYACPDTAACDPSFAGFFYQVYYAARQFKRYKTFPENYNYRAGYTSYVQWHPNSGCGGTNFAMSNHATAGLHNYTPYRPNKAALDNLYGEGNSCSSYGNRNFWRMYNDWFGSTLVSPTPDLPIAGDWNGDGVDTVGVKRLDEYILNNGFDGTAEVDFIYGVPSDTGFSGDWNGNGADTVGVRRGRIFYLNNEYDTSPSMKFAFGRSTDLPIAGDWNGDGNNTVGVKRGKYYYLDYNNDGVADGVFVFGESTDVPVVGDWNGDGKDEIGLKRGKYFYLDSSNNGKADVVFPYGISTDGPIAGDWNGDGKDEIGLKRGKYFYLNYNYDGTADIEFPFGR